MNFHLQPPDHKTIPIKSELSDQEATRIRLPSPNDDFYKTLITPQCNTSPHKSYHKQFQSNLQNFIKHPYTSSHPVLSHPFSFFIHKTLPILHNNLHSSNICSSFQNSFFTNHHVEAKTNDNACYKDENNNEIYNETIKNYYEKTSKNNNTKRNKKHHNNKDYNKYLNDQNKNDQKLPENSEISFQNTTKHTTYANKASFFPHPGLSSESMHSFCSFANYGMDDYSYKFEW